MSYGGRRVIQPPGGASNIIFGNDEPNPPKMFNQKNGSNDEVKKQVDIPVANQGSSNSEAIRNKNNQKSSVVFGDERTVSAGQSASQSAATNKAGQTHRNYNLITGETNAEDSGPKKAPVQTQDKPSEPAATTSIKVHHPPGGKSSGPLW